MELEKLIEFHTFKLKIDEYIDFEEVVRVTSKYTALCSTEWESTHIDYSINNGVLELIIDTSFSNFVSEDIRSLLSQRLGDDTYEFEEYFQPIYKKED